MDGKKGRGFSTLSRFSAPCSRKGQVTIFIIIGIAILFIFAGVLYVMKSTVTEQTDAEGVPIITSVPAEFQPLQVYTENCLRDTAKQGLKLLGQQGGYIYPELAGKFTFTPAEADGILLGSTSIPYWYYRVNPNPEEAHVYSSLQPKVKQSEDPSLSVEAQLNRFIRERIGSCLNEYHPFLEQGYDIKSSPDKQKVSTTVGETSVNVLLELPVQAQKGSAEKELTKFYVQIPLALRHYFDVAAQITETEQDVRFLERQGMELVSIYSRKDSNYLAPIALDGYDLASNIIWSEADLKQKYNELLSSYVPMLQFLGSANFFYAPISGILTQKATDNAVLSLTGAEDVDVTFTYVPSEIYFKTNSKNGVLAPNSALVHANLLTFGFQEFDTHYDISYPVLVTLRAPGALDGEDYLFNFALESNIRNNRPAPAGILPVKRDPLPLSPIVCNPEQRDTGLLRTVVVDSYTKEPLETVRVGFTIPEQAECEMGLTDAQGVVEEKYPAVYGGVVTFLKPEYLTNFYPLDTYKLKDKTSILGYAVADIPAPKVIELDRIKTININVLKKNVEKCMTPLLCEYTKGVHALLLPYKDISCSLGAKQCFFPAGGSVFGAGKPLLELEAEGSLSGVSSYHLTQTVLPLAADEEAMVTLERVRGLHPEVVGDAFSAVVSVKGSQPAGSPPASVKLVPGIYQVSIQAIKKSKVTIPGDERCFAYDLLTVAQQECSQLSPSDLDSYILGGLNWNSSATYLTITPEMLYPAQTLTFTVPTQNIQAIPVKITAPQKECEGFLCAGSGCLFETCNEKKFSLSGRTVEDLQVPAQVIEKTSLAEYRSTFKPVFG
ncbi:hypothetical protein J4210_02220 [Candidatus Woesearchaeota archaeon]|nr:hypothetical protein [Candidatus Woesearchaeota archaeon]